MEKSVDPLKAVTFRCNVCAQNFRTEPGWVEEVADRPWHPWVYFAQCPVCMTDDCEQAGWEKGLLAAWGRQTGPRTEEGKAAVAKNLEGHPTPEEAQRTRFNAMRHGLAARTAKYFPAKPGRYPECEGCEYVVDEKCREYAACVKKTELFLKHQIAFETKNPDLLTDLNADMQAAVRAIIDSLMRSIIAHGPQYEAPKMYYDKHGECHVFEYTDDNGERRVVMERYANPLLKHLWDALAKNGLTLSDMAMTQKVHDDEEMMGGFLDAQKVSQDQTEAYQKQIATGVQGLRQLIENSQSRIKRDPILIEYRDGEDDG